MVKFQDQPRLLCTYVVAADKHVVSLSLFLPPFVRICIAIRTIFLLIC